MGLDVTGRFRYPPPMPEWLARHREDVLEPHLPIVDAHHHFWEEGGHAYLLPELMNDLGDGHLVTATMYAQCQYGYRAQGADHLRPVGETETIVAIAREARRQCCRTRIAAGIVAHADLLLGERVGTVLDAHQQVAGNALKGIRHAVSRDENFPEGVVLRPAPAGMLSNINYRQGLQVLARRGLVYDAMLYHQQLPELTAMAKAIPDLSIVLDHTGCILGVGFYEGRQDDLFEDWRSDIGELAACPNVTVKIGGFGMIICGARWHEHPHPPSSIELAQVWRRYVETCIELFGTRRCMFESNFPVDKAMYSYRTLWNAFKRLTVGLAPGERTDLFSRTARRTYGLDPVFDERQAPVSLHA